MEDTTHSDNNSFSTEDNGRRQDDTKSGNSEEGKENKCTFSSYAMENFLRRINREIDEFKDYPRDQCRLSGCEWLARVSKDR